MRSWSVVMVLVLVIACGGRKEVPPPMTLVELQPTAGHPKGGKVVQIVGTGFDTRSTVEVKFGAVVVRAIVVSKERIQLESPPGKEGDEVTVTVKFPDGRGGVMPQKYRWEVTLPHDDHDHGAGSAAP